MLFLLTASGRDCLTARASQEAEKVEGNLA